MKKLKSRTNKGITLIALVITIIVLLILAGVSIAMLTGENGILTQANNAKVETRGAAVEERKNLWKSEQDMDKRLGTSDAKELSELLDELEEEKLLIGNERQTIEETGKVTIGTRTIEFEGAKLNAHLMALANYDSGHPEVLVYADIDFEEYFNILSEEQKMELIIKFFGEEMLEKMEQYYNVEISTWDTFVEYLAKAEYNNQQETEITQEQKEEFEKMLQVEIIGGSIRIELPKNKYLGLGGIEDWTNNEFFYVVDYNNFDGQDIIYSYYYKDTDCKIKMYDTLGIINEEIDVSYLFNIYSCVAGFPAALPIEGEEKDAELIEPTYIYLENGKKVNYTEYFIEYEVEGEKMKAYNYKENPLNLEFNTMYVIEAEINGHKTKGYIVIPEEYKDFPNNWIN